MTHDDRNTRRRRAIPLQFAVFLVLVQTTLGIVATDARQQAGDRQVPPLRFEVVSVRPMQPGSGPPPFIGSDTCIFRTGRFACPGVTVRGLVSMAYQGNDGRIPVERVYGPDWTGSLQFSVNAVTRTDQSQNILTQRLPAMIRGLLEDRFNLRAHIENRNTPVYMLVRSRRDGRLGSQIRAAKDDCPKPSQREGTDAPPVPTTPATASAPCHGGRFEDGTIISSAVRIATLTDVINRLHLTDRMVIDGTDLKGVYELELHWKPDSSAMPAGPTSIDSFASSPNNRTSLFTALQEQLGLKLEPHSAAVPAVIIDHVDSPTAN